MPPSKPIDVKPAEVKPRDGSPIRPSIDPRTPSKPSAASPGTHVDRPNTPRPSRNDDAPIGRPTNPPLARPDPVIIRTPRDVNGVGASASRQKPPTLPLRDSGKPPREQFTSDSVHGVPVVLHRERDEGARHDRAEHIDNRTYGRYVSNVERCNGWGFGSRWSDCGPCHTWQRYDCHDGLRVSFGFGGGFSFGFYYGTSCAPLCASWCNPWWEGYACSWSCAPYRCSPWWYGSACWNPCRPWWYGAYTCGPCPIATWTPCYGYAFYTSTVYVPPVAPDPILPAPDALWTMLADGYDRDAEDGFILLESAYPADARWTLGQAFARAFRSDTARSADLFREAFANDPSAILRCPNDVRLETRLESLERALVPAATATRPSTDALVALAATQAARGELRDAYLNATTAEAEGDRSRGTASFVTWLRAELRRIP